MIKPPIEELLKETPGRFALVITSAKRAKDINSYFNQLGEGIGAYTPPQVQSLSRKPLTVAFEEIAAGKVCLLYTSPSPRDGLLSRMPSSA